MRKVLVLCALGVAGCGSAASRPAAGAEVFSGECSVCHSLIGNESKHTQGGDLVGFRLSRRTLTQFTREMPVKHRLDAAQLRAVVAYVLAAERGGRLRLTGSG